MLPCGLLMSQLSSVEKPQVVFVMIKLVVGTKNRLRPSLVEEIIEDDLVKNTSTQKTT